MDETIGICTICYSGYGKFIKQWAKAINKLTIKPDKITLVLGDDYGEFDTLDPNFTNLNVNIIHSIGTNMGHLKNIAVENTKTDWITMLEVDDPILPNALEEFKKHQDGDLIISPFELKYNGETKLCTPKPTIEEMASGELWLIAHKNFFHGSAPFRRTLWEKNKFNEDDNGSCSTALFFMDCAREKAKISFTEKPCFIYNRRLDSHSMISPEKRLERIKIIKNYKRKPQTLSIYAIVKNEEVMIEEMLQSIQGADEIVVCDTGSTDRTIEIAKKYTDKVYTDYIWADDFASAKNHAASKCSGDWLMSMDADIRLEKGGIEKIKDIISRTPFDVINVLLVAKGDGSSHLRDKIYRNNGKIYYKGRAHEHLSKGGVNDRVMPVIYWDYSPNHAKDPDRYIRILSLSLKENPNNARDLFYLAREYYYKKQYDKAMGMFKKYLKLSKSAQEKLEAYYMMAQICWWTQKGDLAREYCGKCVIINPDCAKVLRLMAEMHYEPLKSKWLELAKVAQNRGVMFIK